MKIDWQAAKTYEDILYHKADGIVKNHDQPPSKNAMPIRLWTLRRLFVDAREDTNIGVVMVYWCWTRHRWQIRLLCRGGDQSVRGTAGYVDDGIPRLNVLDLTTSIRSCQVVIALVAGYAINGEPCFMWSVINIAARQCDFGQTVPKSASDGGFVPAIFARIVGQKKAREIWFLCLHCSAGAGNGFG